MIIKRPMYNQKFKCVAFEVLSKQSLTERDENESILYDLIKSSDTQLPLFIPYAFKSHLEAFKEPIDNAIILKLDAEDIDLNYPLAEIQNSAYSIALIINSTKDLAWLNQAEYLGLTEQLVNSVDLNKVISFTKAKERKVIGYGLDNPNSFDQCKIMNMDYYCGDFPFKVIENDISAITANKFNLLELIQNIQDDNCDFQLVANIIKEDPLLSFQILKIVNSAAFSTYQSIDSIDQAIARLGLVNLKNWILALSMKNISDKPKEVIESGLIRAHMAMKLAAFHSDINPQSAYTAGLLSILDCLLNKPIAQLVEQITLADDIKYALLTQTGPLGELLASVIAYEEGSWENLSEKVHTANEFSKIYIECLALVTQSSKAIQS